MAANFHFSNRKTGTTTKNQAGGLARRPTWQARRLARRGRTKHKQAASCKQESAHRSAHRRGGIGTVTAVSAPTGSDTLSHTVVGATPSLSTAHDTRIRPRMVSSFPAARPRPHGSNGGPHGASRCGRPPPKGSIASSISQLLYKHVFR